MKYRHIALLLVLSAATAFAQAPWSGLLTSQRATDWSNVGATIPTGPIQDCSQQPATPITAATINAAISAQIAATQTPKGDNTNPYCKINIPAGTYTFNKKHGI